MLQYVAVCGSMLQCVAVCCSVLQWMESYYRGSFHDTQGSLNGIRTVCCSVLQCVAVCCSVLQCVAVCCSGWSRIVEALFMIYRALYRALYFA